jgi:lysophospholipase L1-like esterase
MRNAALIVGLLMAAMASGCVSPQQSPPLASGDRYVAMGSSFAAGPGIPDYYEEPARPCARSSNNYAHQIARRHGLTLDDVSCSGATTFHLTGPRDAIPPQLDAVNAETRLVTITIGGNDLGYMTKLFAASCAGLAEQGIPPAAACDPIQPAPSEQAYADLSARMDAIAKEVRRRAPAARLVFVDYLTVLPPAGICAATPLGSSEASKIREIASRLAIITAKAAASNGADIIKASALSGDHSACASVAWMNGYPRPDAPVAGAGYHPNAAGMTAVADALDKLLWP